MAGLYQASCNFCLLSLLFLGCQKREYKMLVDVREFKNSWISWTIYDGVPKYAIAVNRPIHLSQSRHEQSTDGRVLQQFLTAGNKRVSIESLDPIGPVIIDGRHFDLKNGSTFLIDLKNDGRVVQVNAQIPLPDKKTAEYSLETDNQTIRDFVDDAEGKIAKPR